MKTNLILALALLAQSAFAQNQPQNPVNPAPQTPTVGVPGYGVPNYGIPGYGYPGYGVPPMGGYYPPMPVPPVTTFPNAQPYFAWCNQVLNILNIDGAQGVALYNAQNFAAARTTFEAAIQKALASAPISGVQPNTYRELVRTQDLITLVSRVQYSNPALKDKMVAYVVMNRINFIKEVNLNLDQVYTIPYYNSCYNQCGTPCNTCNTCNGCPFDVGTYETAIADMAARQLENAQAYASTVIPSRRISVYPLVDAPTYFTIISKASQWAAEDLSVTLFNTSFACAIQQLMALGQEAANLTQYVGDVSAVQYIHEKVKNLAITIRSSNHCR